MIGYLGIISVGLSSGMLAGMTELSGDSVILRGLMFHGYHGVNEEEKKPGLKFLIDVDAWMDLRPSGRSANL
ncbi:hypothetical protein MLD38_006481 [Melastoma candidum]|uniref:Uncharacterized protein n=1 Tax=Melastoma candidum TaxID=119954 RepID=A0ACB9RWG9_9MYRT|nr:hypothetical protein MLD38_006481 [Melastoma candidum]